ncbi:MAG: hypothetical protein V3V59_02905 [Thermodesulfovibrionales bacterium]
MTVSEKTEIKGYCDSLFAELSDMKTRIDCFVDNIKYVEGFNSTVKDTHKRHLKELIEAIDWKLEILTKVCPYEWKGLSEDFESTVSVEIGEDTPGQDPVSGGYIGG